jgi:hypothetical protein
LPNLTGMHYKSLYLQGIHSGYVQALRTGPIFALTRRPAHTEYVSSIEFSEGILYIIFINETQIKHLEWSKTTLLRYILARNSNISRFDVNFPNPTKSSQIAQFDVLSNLMQQISHTSSNICISPIS